MQSRSSEKLLSNIVFKFRAVKTKRTFSRWTARPNYNAVPRTILMSKSLVRYTSDILQTPKEIPFFNPDKPRSDDPKPLKPVVPLSHQSFPKSKQVVPSVTKVLSATMPASAQFLLDRWKESMIKKLGAAGFAKYQKDTFERGRLLHALLAKHLMGHGEPVDGQAELSKQIVQNLWKSIRNVVKDISNVRLVEHVVSHPEMNYRGIVDCVACYGDELVVIDFKTSEKQKKNLDSLYDNPLQVSAYCGALNYDKDIPNHVIDRNISSGLVIVAYIDGSEASTYYLSKEDILEKYWKLWKIRLDQYTHMESSRQHGKSATNSGMPAPGA